MATVVAVTESTPIVDHLRNPPRQRRSEEKVKAVLKAAEKVFGDVGYAAATTTMIAKEAGVSVGTVYRLFVDKRAIASALSDQYFDGILDNMSRASEGVDDGEGLVKLVSTMLWGGADLREFMPGYYAVAAVEGTIEGPGMFDRIRTAQVDLLVDRFGDIASEAGLTDEVCRQAIELVVDTIRTSLIRLPVDLDERKLFLTEIDLMLTGYVASRLGLS